eukprot:COSAG05_NODE_122_length_17611_cov_47.044655_17_plen_110_part_00
MVDVPCNAGDVVLFFESALHASLPWFGPPGTERYVRHVHLLATHYLSLSNLILWVVQSIDSVSHGACDFYPPGGLGWHNGVYLLAAAVGAATHGRRTTGSSVAAAWYFE